MSFDFACDGVVMCPLEFKSTWKTATPYNGKIGYFGSEYQFLILEGWGWGGGAQIHATGRAKDCKGYLRVMNICVRFSRV